MFTREELLEKLHAGEVTIIFKKVNGEMRKMPSTLNINLLPPPTPIVEGKAKREVKDNPDVIRVFCTDKKEWRSFRVDSVVAVM